MAWAAVSAVTLSGNDEAHHTRPTRFRVGLNIRQAGQRLNDRVVDAFVNIRPFFAKAANRHIDEIRFHPSQDLLAYAHALSRTRSEILYKYILRRRRAV